MCSWHWVCYLLLSNEVDNNTYRIGQIEFHSEENDSKERSVGITRSV